jgi:hypothetical protein
MQVVSEIMASSQLNFHGPNLATEEVTSLVVLKGQYHMIFNFKFFFKNHFLLAPEYQGHIELL